MIGIPTAITMFALGGARENANDALITSEMGMLRSQAEFTFSKEESYSNFACDYNSSVQQYCKDIKESGGKVTIYSVEEDYCAYTSLNDEGYYCIDSTGAAGETEIDPSGTCTQGNYKCPNEVSF